MEKIKIAPLLLALLLLCACAGRSEPATSPAPEPSATAKVSPEPTEDPEEIAGRERRALLESAAARIFPALGQSVPAEDFLLWLEAEKYPPVLEELAALPQDQDMAAFLREKTGESLHVLQDGFSGVLDSAEAARAQGIYFSAGGKEITVLALAGDVNLMEGGYVMPAYRAAGSSLAAVFTGGLLEEMRGADIFLVNNEFAFTDRGSPLAGKTYTFRAPPANVSILAEMGVDIAYLANNHVYDYGEEGLYDTLRTLEEAQIPYIGAGMSLEEASVPVYYIVNGWKIAFVGAGCIERYTLFTPGASESSSGIFRTDEKNAERFLAVIGEASQKSDYVIANLHWGIESTTVLEDYQRTLGQMCIDAGANAVVGSHPHVLQGAEFYKGSPIIYSTGNFWFSRTQNYSCLLELLIDDSGELTVKFLPCVTENGATRLSAGDEALKLIRYYEDISFGVDIDSGGIITASR